MFIEVTATICYTYELTEQEEKLVREIITENKDGEFTYGTDEENIAKAFGNLHRSDGTRLYQDSNTVETEFSTDKFSYSEFNNYTAEEWLNNTYPHKSTLF